MLEEYEGSRTKFMKMLADQDCPPAYILRAQRVESVWQDYLTQAKKQRFELLEMPRMRLAQVAYLIDRNWSSLNQGDKVANYLSALYDEWQPKLRAEVLPTTSGSKIRRAMNDLKSSFIRFNKRWEKRVLEADLSLVNYERGQYNDYYLVEKAAALGSDRLAEMGFERLRLYEPADVFQELPLLTIPH